eukprot:TRINITY_DN32693_c0_g1_i1.p1 TRINITY_DN32693_c0_g1~~TRINITY_DN32693_c0_g1_i1.p1  ORF type:complete len:510 (+),score=208.73 TRINITY_DN32693_c0_g1_i1:75-1604(+)
MLPLRARAARRWATHGARRAAAPQAEVPEDHNLLHCSGPLDLKRVDKLMGYVEKAQPDAVVLSGGLLGGGALGDKGKTMVKILNALGVKYVGLSRCDLFFGPEVLQERVAEFNGTVVCNNVAGLDGVVPQVKVGRTTSKLHLTGYVDAVRPGFTIVDGRERTMKLLTDEQISLETHAFYACLTAQDVDADALLAERSPGRKAGAALPLILGTGETSASEDKYDHRVRVVQSGTHGITATRIRVWDASKYGTAVVTDVADLERVAKFKSPALFQALKACVAARAAQLDMPVVPGPRRGDLPEDVQWALVKQEEAGSNPATPDKAEEARLAHLLEVPKGTVARTLDLGDAAAVPMSPVQAAVHAQMKTNALTALKAYLNVDACVAHDGSFSNAAAAAEALPLRGVKQLLPHPTKMCIVELSGVELRELQGFAYEPLWGGWQHGALHFDAGVRALQPEVNRTYTVAVPRVLTSGLYKTPLGRFRDQTELLPHMPVMRLLQGVASEKLAQQQR